MLAFAIGHHARVPAQLVAEIEKPRALQILTHLLTLCNPQKPEVWVDQGLVGRNLGIHRDTVGKWIRYLEDLGRLVFIGFRHDGRRKRYLIKLQTEQSQSQPQEIMSDEIAGGPPAYRSEVVRRFHRTINKEEETNLKEQTVVDVLKKEFSSNAKIALKQKLKILGVHKHIIERLVAKYSMEKIEDQIGHLNFLLKQGSKIEKPAPWLISAIEKNYELPREIDRKVIQEEEKIESMKKAAQLAEEAKSELLLDNIQRAKELAERSLLVADNISAKDLLNKQSEISERQEKIERARQGVSEEQRLMIQQEEERKKLDEMKRICRKSEAEISGSIFFKRAVEELVNQRLLCLV